MFCHDPENQWVLMPFPIIFKEDIQISDLVFTDLHTLTAFVSEILLVRTISASSTNV